jgi:CRP/FNR family cyclic AMP-dependent transcriptional regulator
VKQRFEGEDGRRLLVDTLKEQKLLADSPGLAEAVAGTGEVIAVEPDTRVIEQGAATNDLFLVVSGAFIVRVNNKQVATRGPGDHLGEMAAIQPTQPRAATVVASEPSVVVRLSERQLTDLGSRHPNLYRNIAKELARRLRQRNHLVTQFREKSQVFVLSSTEALPIAEALRALETDSVHVVVWKDGVFRASQYPLEVLEAVLDQSDFGIAIAQPDDLTTSRGQTTPAARDNVLFEVGLFMGRLGRHRTLLMEPKDVRAKLPSDLTGITTVPYTYDPEDLTASMSSALDQIRAVIDDLGPNN